MLCRCTRVCAQHSVVAALEMSSGNITVITTIFTAILSSGILVTGIQMVSGRRERKHKLRQAEIDRDQAEKDRGEMLAEAQATAQRTALESEAKRYGNLERDYENCRRGLGEVRSAAAILIDVFETMMMKLRPIRGGEAFTLTLHQSEVTEARKSIQDARRHLLYFTDLNLRFPHETPPQE